MAKVTTSLSQYKRDAGPWEVLRPLRRRLRCTQNHPHYVTNGNEQALLAQIITAEELAWFSASLAAEKHALNEGVAINQVCRQHQSP